MNTASKAAISFLLACCLLICAAFLRVQPSAKIWPDYQVVYFPENQDLSFLGESAVRDMFPGILSQETSVRSDLVIPPDFSVTTKIYAPMYLSVMEPLYRDGYSADSIRSFFFTDKDGQYQLVYVPDSQFKQFCSLLDSRKMTYGSDSTVNAPYGGGIVAAVLALMLIIIVRPPFLHDLMLVPLVACSFLAPWYSVNCIACAALVLFPFINRYWNRIKGIQLFFRNPVCITLTLLILVLLFLTPFRMVCVTVLCLTASVLTGVAVRLQENWAESNRHFSFTPILSGLFVNVEQKQKSGMLIMYGLAVIVILVLSLFTAAGGSLSESLDLSLPGPKLYNDTIATVDGWDSFIKETAADEAVSEIQRYPDITDFVSELWQRQSSGYRKTIHVGQENQQDMQCENMVPCSGSKVTVSHFAEDENGVHQEEITVLAFDDFWLGRALDWLAENDSVAAFLLHQASTPSTTYQVTGKISFNTRDYAGVILSVTVAAVLCIILLLKSARKRSSNQ